MLQTGTIGSWQWFRAKLFDLWMFFGSRVLPYNYMAAFVDEDEGEIVSITFSKSEQFTKDVLNIVGHGTAYEIVRRVESENERRG
jgi:hypothetical protein